MFAYFSREKAGHPKHQGSLRRVAMRPHNGRASTGNSAPAPAPAFLESLEPRRLMSATVVQMSNNTIGVAAEFVSIDHASGPLGTVSDILVSALTQTISDSSGTTTAPILSLFIQVI